MSFPGSKGQAGTWQRIIGQMPPHSVYVEPFAGSAQVWRRKRPAVRSILIEKDAAVIARIGADNNLVVPDERVFAFADEQFNLLNGAGRTTVINGDSLKLLPVLKLPADAVIYCDPPYLLTTRQQRFYYDHELSDEGHASLLTLLKALRCRVLVSGYPSELYGSQLQGWRCLTYRARTRGKTVTEALWCNFPEPAELHDWRYAGANYRQRLYLKRLAKRWLAKLDAMPARKRGYVLNAIAQRQARRGGPL